MPFVPHSPPYASQIRPKLPPPEIDRIEAALAATTALAEAAAAGPALTEDPDHPGLYLIGA